MVADRAIECNRAYAWRHMIAVSLLYPYRAPPSRATNGKNNPGVGVGGDALTSATLDIARMLSTASRL